MKPDAEELAAHKQVIALVTAAERNKAKKPAADAAFAAYIERYLVPKYPKLKHRLLAFRLRRNENGPDGLGSNRSSAIEWRRGMIDSIETWRWKKPLRDELMKLFADRHTTALRNLCLRDHEVKDLTFLAHLTALENVDFAWGKITKLNSLAPLGKLKKLVRLDVRHSGITDLNPVRRLPLKKLVISGSPVSSLAPLARNTTLECLDAAGTEVSDVRALHSCRRLCYVSLWDAKVSTENAQALVAAMKRNRAKPSPGSDYDRYLAHNDANWFMRS